MRTILLLGSAIIILSFIDGKKQKDNTLTAKEKKEGWKLLFDGTSMNGWRIYNDEKVDDWDVKNGELYCKIDGVTKRGDLITVDKYENFELVVDWKIAPQENSGIIYMVEEANRPSYESGPEYQLIDDDGYPEKLKDAQLSGSNYDMNPPTVKVNKPSGQYNHTRIVVNKGHVEHWLNGTKVVEYELWSPEWYQQKEKSKWKDVKPYGMSKSGHIALQDHGGGVWFKNIKIKPL